MLQNLNMFGRKTDLVDHAEYGVDLTDERPVVVASKGVISDTAQRGTVENLKDVKGPSEEELEADFAFISGILAKAQVAKATVAAAPVASELPKTKPMPQSPAQARPAQSRPVSKTAAPSFVPLHKRGGGPNGGPMHAVQSGPRSTRPIFLQDADEPQIDDVVASDQDAGDLTQTTSDSAAVAKVASTMVLEHTSEQRKCCVSERTITPKPKLPAELFAQDPEDADDLLPIFPEPPAMVRKLLSWLPSPSRAIETSS